MEAGLARTGHADVERKCGDRRRDLFWVIALALVAAFAFSFRLGNYGLIDAGEAYYPAAAREMVEAHSFIVPQQNYQLYFSKPILTYWLLSSSYLMFGVNDLAGRIMPALFGVLLTLCCYAVTRKIACTRAGVLAGLFVCGAPFTMEYFRICAVDAFFTSLMGMAMCALLMVVSAGQLRWWPAIYVLLALAVLTKGPVAIVLFGGGCLAAAIGMRLDRQTIRSCLKVLHPFKGLAILLAVASPWFIAVGVATKGLFLKVFFLYENLSRFSGHTNPGLKWQPWLYLVMLPVCLAPWSLLLFPVYAATFKPWLTRSSAQNAITDNKNPRELLDPKRLCVFWSTAIIVFFSLSKTQLTQYVMPAVPPLAIATALFVEQWCANESESGRKWLRYWSQSALVIGPLLAVAAVVCACVLKSEDVPDWARIVVPVAAAVNAIVWVMQRRLFKAGMIMQSIAVMMLSVMFLSRVSLSAGLEYRYNLRSKDLHTLCRIAKTLPEPLAVYKIHLPSVMYYTQRPVNCFYHADSLVSAPGHRVSILIRAWEFDELQASSHIQLRKLAQERLWILCEANNAKVEPYLTLEETFSRLFSRMPINEVIANRNDFGALTDCISEGTLWRGDRRVSSRH